jgi:UDP-N-acetylmuramate--alanine ligase
VFRGKIDQIHFVGIGGTGMNGIAQVLIDLGFRVTGSDLARGEAVDRLTSLGATVFVGPHCASHVGDADVVVASSAVRPDNPEVLEARRRGVPVIPRAEMLAELMRLKHGVAIAGSHGKTTTTSLVATVLEAAGLDPTVVIGGKLNAFGSNAKLGKGDLLVAEADESDGSFLHLAPTLAAITNIDPEHLDHYGSMDRLLDTFVAFANKVPFYGLCVLCLDHPNVRAILPRIEKRTVTYGLSEEADVRARDVWTEGLSVSFEAIRCGAPLGRVRLRMPGVHNVLNALAALALADELNVEFGTAAAALESFEGVARRFTVLGEARGVTVVDDYGHHPAEIMATLEAGQRAYGRRIVAVFQPHRFSRVELLRREFEHAFDRADVLVVLPVYAAGEDPIEGVSGESLAEGVRGHGHPAVTYQPGLDEAARWLAGNVDEGDVVITLGAGSVNRVGRSLLERLAGGDRPRDGGQDR